jgi:hypothetical protein
MPLDTDLSELARQVAARRLSGGVTRGQQRPNQQDISWPEFGQHLYNRWLSPFERLGTAATSGTLNAADPQAVADALSAAGTVTGARFPLSRGIGELGIGPGRPRSPYVAQPEQAYRSLRPGGEPLSPQEQQIYDAVTGQRDPPEFLRHFWTPLYNPATHQFSAGITPAGNTSLFLSTGFRSPTGEPVGTSTRNIYPSKGMMSFAGLELEPKFQGMGIGPNVFRGNIAATQQFPLPVNRIGATAGLEGGGAYWAREGAIANPEDWARLQSRDLRTRIDDLVRNTNLTPERANELNAMLGYLGTDPRALHFMRSLDDPIRGTIPPWAEGAPREPIDSTLGNALLRNQWYRARWDFLNPRHGEWQRSVINAGARPLKPWPR